MLARLRWSAFGLRGRIVGAVVLTTAVTLGVAALVLMPQLENALKNASRTTLQKGVGYASADLASLGRIPYWYIVPAFLEGSHHSPLEQAAQTANNQLANGETQLGRGLGGVTGVTLIGYIDAHGSGRPVIPAISRDNGLGAGTGGAASISAQDVVGAFRTHNTQYSFGPNVVRATIWLDPSSVLVVTASISEIPSAVAAVRRAFEIAAAAAILLTIAIAIPLAGTLVSRLRRLRQAALQIAIDGSGRASFPVDRARDEVGDLARSFSIMQRRLRQQEEARRAFVATASHELRTPLASLEGMLELLADDLQAEQFDLDDANALLDRARAQSRRLGRLAADLLDLSRMDAEVTLRSEPVELGELARAVSAEFDVASLERGVVTVLDDDGAPVWALADPGSVARILRILVDNALRVAPRGSEVRVFVASSPVPMLSVIDQGPGVVPEERALIFDRFKRGTETGGEAGFGLGLAIGRELAQRMGGSLVLADSDAPGATFTLTLRPTQAPSPDQLTSSVGV